VPVENPLTLPIRRNSEPRQIAKTLNGSLPVSTEGSPVEEPDSGIARNREVFVTCL
jgi:hypothetical protein